MNKMEIMKGDDGIISRLRTQKKPEERDQRIEKRRNKLLIISICVGIIVLVVSLVGLKTNLVQGILLAMTFTAFCVLVSTLILRL